MQIKVRCIDMGIRTSDCCIIISKPMHVNAETGLEFARDLFIEIVARSSRLSRERKQRISILTVECYIVNEQSSHSVSDN